MWNAQIDSSDGDRVCRVRVLRNGNPASYSEIIKGWQFDAVFRTFFNRVLAEAPYCAYLWETPAISRNNLSRAFEFVFVDNPPAIFGFVAIRPQSIIPCGSSE